MGEQSANPAAEAFTKFWTDAFAQVNSVAGASNPFAAAQAPNPVDFSRQMQRGFLDAMAKSCDEFLRSEQYLEMMKRSMDAALGFRQQLNAFLRDAQQNMQSPTLGDVSDIVAALESMEQRVVSRLDDIEERLAAVEAGPVPAASETAAPRSAAARKPARKAPPRRR